jgi:cob(I)alamin adenosyltransferase
VTGRGLVHIYTGDGKGKTTASVGLAVRAAGDGLRVLFAQFLKGRQTGELDPLRQLGVTVMRTPEVVKFIPSMSPAEREECRCAQRACLSGVIGKAADFDLIILDEAMAAVETGMIGLDELIRFIRSKPEGLELALTGRNAPPELVALADYVSEIKAVRHPYERGIAARRGIEY